MTSLVVKMDELAEEMVGMSESLQKTAMQHDDETKFLRAIQLHIVALQMREWLINVKRDDSAI